MWRERQLIYLLVTHKLLFNRGESVTVQAGKVTASAWMDRKMVMVMSTNCQPSSCGTVNRKQRDGTSVEVPCPESIISYSKFMGGVDRGDQLCGYYRCRSKSRNIFFLSLCCGNHQCLPPAQGFRLLPLQGLQVVLTATRKRTDRGLL